MIIGQRYQGYSLCAELTSVPSPSISTSTVSLPIRFRYMASWKNPGRAIRVVIHEEEGDPRYYWRHEDAEGNTSWRKDAPLVGEKSSGEELTTAELAKGIEASLTERRRVSRGRKLRMPFR
jgi:hypothetical protein